MASPLKTYDIILSSELLVDPTFEKVKKFTEFFPVKFKTIESSKFEKLSASSRSLLVHLVGLAHAQGSPKIALSVLDVPSFRGASVESLFSELSNYGYLDAPYIKENIERKEKKETISTEPQKAVAVVAAKPTLTISLISKDVPISVDLAKSWADTYPKEYLELELKKARSWLITNPHKSPKSNYGRFFNSWFDRGWEKYRQTLKSNPTQITVEDLEAILKKDAE